MARVTVEDCLENVDNRFELVMLATKRSRQLATGGKEPKVAWENDKPTVVALREIAAGLVDAEFVAQEDLVEEEPLFAAAFEEGFAQRVSHRQLEPLLPRAQPHRRESLESEDFADRQAHDSCSATESAAG